MIYILYSFYRTTSGLLNGFTTPYWHKTYLRPPNYRVVNCKLTETENEKVHFY